MKQGQFLQYYTINQYMLPSSLILPKKNLDPAAMTGSSRHHFFQQDKLPVPADWVTNTWDPGDGFPVAVPVTVPVVVVTTVVLAVPLRTVQVQGVANSWGSPVLVLLMDGWKILTGDFPGEKRVPRFLIWSRKIAVYIRYVYIFIYLTINYSCK